MNRYSIKDYDRQGCHLSIKVGLTFVLRLRGDFSGSAYLIIQYTVVTNDILEWIE